MSFKAKIHIIGINPYVLVPVVQLEALFKAAGKTKGPIPVKGTIDGHPFIQTLVKYSGKWRLYLNGPMRKAAGKEVGDKATFELSYDDQPWTITMHPDLKAALAQNKAAKKVFDQLPPSRQKEIIKYIASLKTSASVEKNIQRTLLFLTGKNPDDRPK